MPAVGKISKRELKATLEGTHAMQLPLLDSELVSRLPPGSRGALVRIGRVPQPLIPERSLEGGEQYRFHFDMTKCIGCQCCVVACNEQNGNPAVINWRRP
jgi:ferredoxin